MTVILTAAWIAYLYAAVRFLFHGFRIGDSLATTAMAFVAGFILLIFFTCRRLFRPSRKDRQAAEYILSGLREKNQDPDR